MLVNETNKVYLTVVLKITLKTIWQERTIWLKYPFKKGILSFFSLFFFSFSFFEVNKRYASDLRIFAMEQITHLGIQYQKTELFKNVPWEPHTMI